MQLGEWKEFYGLEGTASATLLGLLFVAVALNADLILAGGRTQTKIRAEQAFQNYVAVLFISQILLFPRLPQEFASVSLVTQGTVMIVYSFVRLIQTAKVTEPSSDRIHGWRRMISSLVAYGFIIFGAERMMHQNDDLVFYCVGFGTIFLLLSATLSSWELLIRVAELRHRVSRQ